jgi:lysophospholipase L1-like esterase
MPHAALASSIPLTTLALLLLSPLAPAADQQQPIPLPQDWDYAPAMKALAAKSNTAARPGVVLHVGDSITYASPYAAWARAGQGRSPADLDALKWMHAGAKDDTDGWYLASFDHPAGGRSYTACGGIRADEMLAGGKQHMPKFADLLDQYKPQAVVLMLGTNDASANRPLEAYRRDMESMLDATLSRGIVPILSTIPPHIHRQALAHSYNDALREIARKRQLALIDFEREILTRRPDDWDGTLLNKGDVHPTADRAGVKTTSEPTPQNLRNSGYLLRSWLSVKKIAEVKRAVFDRAPSRGGAQATDPKDRNPAFCNNRTIAKTRPPPSPHNHSDSFLRGNIGPNTLSSLLAGQARLNPVSPARV